MAVNFFDNFPVWPWPFVNIQIIVWQFSCIAMSLHIDLTIFLYCCEAFWKFSSMAVWLSAWPTDGNFSCKNHFRCFWQFSCMALNFFDNFTVWPWPYKFIRKKFDNFPVWFFDNFPVWFFDNFPVPHIFHPQWISYCFWEIQVLHPNYFQKQHFTADIPFLRRSSLRTAAILGVISDIHRVRTHPEVKITGIGG